MMKTKIIRMGSLSLTVFIAIYLYLSYPNPNEIYDGIVLEGKAENIVKLYKHTLRKLIEIDDKRISSHKSVRDHYMKNKPACPKCYG